MVAPRKFKPRKNPLDTGVRLPRHEDHGPPDKTHRDAAAEVKLRAERERLLRDQSMDPVERAEKLNTLDREARQSEDGEDETS